MKQREYAYDNLKFLLIILVIAGHLADFYTEPGADVSSELAAAARGLYGFIYVFHMPAFVFVGGLFAKSALSDRTRALKKAGGFVVLYILCKVLLGLPSMLLRRTFDFDLFSESGIPWFMLSMAWWFLATWFLKRVTHPGELQVTYSAGKNGAQVTYSAGQNAAQITHFAGQNGAQITHSAGQNAAQITHSAGQNAPQPQLRNVFLVIAANIVLACILGYTDMAGDFLCLSKTIVFYPFFLAGFCLDARKLLAHVQKPACRAVGTAGILLLVLTAAAQPQFLYGLRPLLNGRGNAYAQVAENFADICRQTEAVSDAVGLLADPAYGAFWRLAYYAAAAFMIYCLVAVIPRKKLPVSVFGSRTLQVYFLHYIFLYPLKIVPVVEKMQTVFPTAVCVLFMLAVSVGLAMLLSLPKFKTCTHNHIVLK